MHDLYPYAVDYIARTRLRAANVRLTSSTRRTRSAIEMFLEGLTAPTPELPENSGYSALERKLTKWVDDGLTQLNTSPWKVVLHLDEREDDGLALQVWLQAEDDATLSLPASVLWSEGGDEVFAFLRASDARRALIRGLAEIEPVLAEGGIAFDELEPAEAVLDPDRVKFFLREAIPRLEELGVPVLLPGEWLRGASKVRVNLRATTKRDASARSSGLLGTSELAAFDWRLAIGDSELSEEELQELDHDERPVRADRRARGMRCSVRTSRRRCGSSRSGAAVRGSSISCVRCRGSRRTRRVSSSARCRSTRCWTTCCTAARTGTSIRCRRRRR